MDPIRIAFLGTGMIARKCLEPAVLAEGCRVTAVASRDRTRASAFIEEHRPLLGSCEALAARSLLERDDIDAVYVTVPNHLHVGWSLALLESGKHVLCEKPASPWREEVERVVEVAASQGLAWQEAFMYPHHPQTDRLVEITRTAMTDPERSVIGQLRMIRAEAVVDLGDGAHVEHRLRHSTQGGALQDVGVYPLGIARYLSGEEPVAMRANAIPARMPAGEQHAVDGSMFLHFTLPSGVLCSASTSLDAWAGHGLELVGTTGVVRTGYPYWPDPERAVLEVVRSGGERESIVLAAGGERIRLQFEHFASACRGEGAIIPSQSWSIGQAGAIESAWSSLGWAALPRSGAIEV